MTEKNSLLEQHGIQQLSDFAHTRKRTEMFLGSKSEHSQPVVIFDNNTFSINEMSWVPALVTCIREAYNNCTDAFIKFKTKDPVLKIDYNEETLEFVVSDNSVGIPIDWLADKQKHICTMVLTEARTGSNFNDAERKGGSIGMNGGGMSYVMMCSEYAEIEIVRAGRPYKSDKENDSYDGMYKFTQRIHEGNALFQELLIDEPTIRKVKSEKTGTTIKFKLSSEVFNKRTLPTTFLRSLLKEVSVSNPKIKVIFNGEQLSAKKPVEKNLFNGRTVITHTVLDYSFNLKSDFYIVPNAIEGTDKNFLMYGNVNDAPSFDGGIHLSTFQQKFALGLIKALEKESKRRKLRPNRSDVEEGLLIYNITKMDAPVFGNQSKTQLTSEEVIKPIEKSLDDTFYENIIKKHKAWIDEIYERCALRTNKKSDEEDRRAAKKLLKNKVAKLLDATSKERSDCTLFLAEGDSAVSNMTAARDSKIHGILPLRGKIMNVSGNEKTKDLMASSSLHDIMSSINLVPGEKADRSKLNYGRVFIAADSDDDGLNINCLIVNFLYKFWPELFQDPDNPFVYCFTTPFIILEKGKEVKYFYGHNQHEYIPEEWNGWSVTRAKGLGTLEKHNFTDAIYNGYAIPYIDDGKLDETLQLIFDKSRADDRKEWMKDKEHDAE